MCWWRVSPGGLGGTHAGGAFTGHREGAGRWHGRATVLAAPGGPACGLGSGMGAACAGWGSGGCRGLHPWCVWVLPGRQSQVRWLCCWAVHVAVGDKQGSGNGIFQLGWQLPRGSPKQGAESQTEMGQFGGLGKVPTQSLVLCHGQTQQQLLRGHISPEQFLCCERASILTLPTAPGTVLGLHPGVPACPLPFLTDAGVS